MYWKINIDVIGENCNILSCTINTFISLFQSGLTEAVRKSNISLDDAEQQMLDFVKKHTHKKQAPLAGNSVHVDRQFLEKYMKNFMNHLHYRIIDVSTVKELCRYFCSKINHFRSDQFSRSYHFVGMINLWFVVNVHVSSKFVVYTALLACRFVGLVSAKNNEPRKY